MAQGLGDGEFKREHFPNRPRGAGRRRERFLCFLVVGDQQERRLFHVRRPELVATHGIQDEDLCT